MANPVELGTVHDATLTSGSGNMVLTTSANHLAGQLLVVAAAVSASRTIGAMTDSAGNSYTQIAQASQASIKCVLFRSGGTIALGSGGTITLATTGIGAGEGEMTALAVFPYKHVTDASGTNTGASGEPSVAITTVAAKTISIAYYGQVGNLIDPGYTADADWTDLNTVLGTAHKLSGAYRIRTSAGADTFNPTTNISAAFAAAAMSMELSEGFNLPILGVG